MFASDLGWAPGTWPTSFEHDGKTWRRTTSFRHGGEFAGYKYVSGVEEMTVFND